MGFEIEPTKHFVMGEGRGLVTKRQNILKSISSSPWLLSTWLCLLNLCKFPCYGPRHWWSSSDNCDESGSRIGQLIVSHDKPGYGGKFSPVKVTKKSVPYLFRGLK